MGVAANVRMRKRSRCTRTELKCMTKYRYWLAVEGRTKLCLLCWLMKAIVVMHQETHHSGGIPLCILIMPECSAQNLEGSSVRDEPRPKALGTTWDEARSCHCCLNRSATVRQKLQQAGMVLFTQARSLVATLQSS